MNAHLGRFNRTLQQSLVGYQEDSFFTDMELFHRKLAYGLLFYNAQLPHFFLGKRSLLSFLWQHCAERQGRGSVHFSAPPGESPTQSTQS